MPHFRISRRRLLIALTAGVSATATGWYRAQDSGLDGSLDIEVPAAPDLEQPDFELFLTLSKLVTLRSKLDRPTAQRMFPLFMDEPWGPHHTGSTYSQLLELAGLPPYSSPPLTAAVRDRLGTGQAWFASHLLLTWYLGIYYHEERPTRRVAWETALMYEAARGAMNVPFIEATGFGAWAGPPEGLE